MPLSQAAGLPQGGYLPPHLPRSTSPSPFSLFLSSPCTALYLCPTHILSVAQCNKLFQEQTTLVTLRHLWLLSLYRGPSSNAGSSWGSDPILVASRQQEDKEAKAHDCDSPWDSSSFLTRMDITCIPYLLGLPGWVNLLCLMPSMHLYTINNDTGWISETEFYVSLDCLDGSTN